ncbi:MAG TPA: hypothetical protein VJQ51_12370 [Burkholderiales bacterium]|nr:hypothetical protein [Burkholderiales bacterium]
MNRYRWLASRMASALGLRGLIGLGCLAAAALAYLLVLVPMSAELGKARDEANVLQQERGKRGGKPSDPGVPLASFYRFFPPAASAPELLDKLYSSASGRSIVLDQAEYRLTRERDGKLSRYQITLPVRASYPQLRGFVEDVLAQIPSAALEGIGFKRDSISAEAVDAQIRFVIYLAGA